MRTVIIRHANGHAMRIVVITTRRRRLAGIARNMRAAGLPPCAVAAALRISTTRVAALIATSGLWGSLVADALREMA